MSNVVIVIVTVDVNVGEGGPWARDAMRAVPVRSVFLAKVSFRICS